MSLLDREHHLVVSRRMWRSLIWELRVRGRGTRESGAFLLGKKRRWRTRVRGVEYFDDLEAGSLNGAIHLTHRAYAALSNKCSRTGLQVVADVHTHPGENVKQSHIDEANPLISLRGHVALIVPRYASGKVTFDRVGVYEYLGDDGWRDCHTAIRHRRFG